MSIIIENLSFTYNKKTPFSVSALKNINLTVKEGEFVSIIGHTGSGKSTFVQHLNGLIKAQSGKIIIDGIDITAKKADLRALRMKVGMVFQYPEYQLFADTVYKDVAFGCKNMKLSEEETKNRVREAIRLVGLDESFFDKAPFELSGGEKRRVAIAGVIVMQPKILILDEPTAGLDPVGKREILSLINHLKKTVSPTVIMIGHDMNEVVENATKVVVFVDGEVRRYLPPEELFKETEFIQSIGLELPHSVAIKEILKKHKIILKSPCLTIENLFEELMAKNA